MARPRSPCFLARLVALIVAAAALGGACSGEGGERSVPSTNSEIAQGAATSGGDTAQVTDGQPVPLPSPRTDGELSLEQAISGRRSVREYTEEGLSLADLGQLLWAAQGITETGGAGRASPSAGGLYPLELRAVVEQVGGLVPGVYRYVSERHELEPAGGGSRREALTDAGLSQEALAGAPAVLVVSGVFSRTTAKYGERGIGYVFMEAGHAAQNVYLQAVSLGLGTVSIGAFDDGAVANAVGLPAEEQPLYLMPVGWPDTLP